MVDTIKDPNSNTDERPARANKNFMRRRGGYDGEKEKSEFEERVIEIRRVSRTVKGGRRIRFRALVVIGNKKGKVGAGTGKANDVSEAVKKAVTSAKKDMIVVPMVNGSIPYEITTKFASAVVMMRPAAPGSSIVAGGAVRAVAELAGITDLLSKMMGSPNKLNNVMATLKAFSSFNPGYTKRITDYAESKKKLIEAHEVKIEAKVDKVEEAVAEEKKIANPTSPKGLRGAGKLSVKKAANPTSTKRLRGAGKEMKK